MSGNKYYCAKFPLISTTDLLSGNCFIDGGPVNFPQPHLKNWRVGIRTKLCWVPEPFLCLTTRLFSTPLSVETAWKQCRRPGPLSPGQAVELSAESPLLSLHACHSFPFISASLFHLWSVNHLPFSPGWNLVVQFNHCLLWPCQDQPYAVRYPG